MKKCVIFLSLLLTILLAAVAPILADEEPLWSNFNIGAVQNGPKYYSGAPLREDTDPVLITKVRTYHWNNGNGAVPGTISICEDELNNVIGTWPAIGRSSSGKSNVYWEALVDCVMYPGHTYYVRDSDKATWSWNDESEGGFYELYGIWPAPEGYAVPALPKAGWDTLPANLSVGQTFTFGTYEQDNILGSGKEPIEWQVLTIKNGDALVISKYGLEVIDHTTLTGTTTWDTNTYRAWLNGDFYNTAFSDAEKSRILTVTNENMANPITGVKSGKQTQDRIFLLALDEAEYYFRSNEDRKCEPTPYARMKSTNSHNDGTSTWILRTAGMDEDLKALVLNNGSIEYWGLPCDAIEGCEKTFFLLRPAFWLSPTDIPETASNSGNCYRVTYAGNNCLAKVPIDNQCYQLGDLVTLRYEPVEYLPGQLFYGWDMDGDGEAEFGFNYPTFAMTNRDVVLNAVCYPVNQGNNNGQYNDVISVGGDVQQYYNPNHDPMLNDNIYDPNTGWWFSPEDYYNYYSHPGRG